jgi:cytidylate kinase
LTDLGPAAPVAVVAVDGPSGSGKGTVCRRLAQTLGWHLLDSGALYRLVALAGQRAGLSAEDVEGHAGLARSMDVAFSVAADGGECILLAGVDVTAGVRDERTGQGASRVAAWPAVREALFDRQRRFAESPGLIADGRDMGTVVFTDAPLKVFLTASAEERALRRY